MLILDIDHADTALPFTPKSTRLMPLQSEKSLHDETNSINLSNNAFQTHS